MTCAMCAALLKVIFIVVQFGENARVLWRGRTRIICRYVMF